MQLARAESDLPTWQYWQLGCQPSSRAQVLDLTGKAAGPLAGSVSQLARPLVTGHRNAGPQ